MCLCHQLLQGDPVTLISTDHNICASDPFLLSQRLQMAHIFDLSLPKCVRCIVQTLEDVEKQVHFTQLFHEDEFGYEYSHFQVYVIVQWGK